VIWHLGYSDSKSAVAFTQSYGVFQLMFKGLWVSPDDFPES
jgi:hypothetical protein